MDNTMDYGADILTLVDDDGVEHQFEVADTMQATCGPSQTRISSIPSLICLWSVWKRNSTSSMN